MIKRLLNFVGWLLLAPSKPNFESLGLQQYELPGPATVGDKCCGNCKYFIAGEYCSRGENLIHVSADDWCTLHKDVEYGDQSRPTAIICRPEHLESMKELAASTVECKSEVLALDVSMETARALHRVWRALNDGDCPKCHRFISSFGVARDGSPGENGQSISCPKCGFEILDFEIAEIQEMFRPAMDACVEKFEEWRRKRVGFVGAKNSRARKWLDEIDQKDLRHASNQSQWH